MFSLEDNQLGMGGQKQEYSHAVNNLAEMHGATYQGEIIDEYKDGLLSCSDDEDDDVYE